MTMATYLAAGYLKIEKGGKKRKGEKPREMMQDFRQYEAYSYAGYHNLGSATPR